MLPSFSPPLKIPSSINNLPCVFFSSFMWYNISVNKKECGMVNEIFVVEVATGKIQFVIERNKTNSDLDALAWANLIEGSWSFYAPEDFYAEVA